MASLTKLLLVFYSFFFVFSFLSRVVQFCDIKKIRLKSELYRQKVKR